MRRTLYQLQQSMSELPPNFDGAYYDKMVHPIPDTECVDRIRFILSRCIDKTILDIGCDGPLHEQIIQVAKECFGIDKTVKDGDHLWRVDIETDPTFPILIREVYNKVKAPFDLILCGEIIEHLSNPGNFLSNLSHFECPLLITVPNAFGRLHTQWLKKGYENVNKEHVAFYSYHTLKTLVERFNYKIEEFYWAGEPHYFSEGLIMVVKQGG